MMTSFDADEYILAYSGNKYNRFLFNLIKKNGPDAEKRRIRIA